MNNRLLPCPFCGRSDCLLIEHMEGTVVHPTYRVCCDNCGASSRFTDKGHIEAWNSRATQPAAGEPVAVMYKDGTVLTRADCQDEEVFRICCKVETPLCAAPPAAAPVAAGEPAAEFFVDFDTLRKALSIYGLAAPVSNEELGLQMDRQAVRVIEAVARLPFPYPPAAAHGDEAVRKDAEAAYIEMTCQPVLIDGAHHYYLSSERMQAFDRLFSVDVSDAAMRAQADK